MPCVKPARHVDRLGVPRTRCRCGRCEQFDTNARPQPSPKPEISEEELCLKCGCPNTNHRRLSWRPYSFVRRRFKEDLPLETPYLSVESRKQKSRWVASDNREKTKPPPEASAPTKAESEEECSATLVTGSTSTEGSVRTVTSASSPHDKGSPDSFFKPSAILSPATSIPSPPTSSPSQPKAASHTPKSPPSKSQKENASTVLRKTPPQSSPVLQPSKTNLPSTSVSKATAKICKSPSRKSPVEEDTPSPPPAPSTPRAFKATMAQLKLKGDLSLADMLHNVEKFTRGIQILNSCNSGGIYIERIAQLQTSRALFCYKIGNSAELSNVKALEHTTRAVEDCKYVLQSNKSHAPALIIQACCDLRFGGFARAKAKIHKATDLLHKLKRAGEKPYQHAAYGVESLCELARDAGDLAEKLGRVKRSAANYLKNNQGDRALLLLKTISEHSKWSTDIAMLIVRALIISGKYNQCIQRCSSFQELLAQRLDSNAILAFERLRAKCFMYQGKASKAIQVLEKASKAHMDENTTAELEEYRTMNDLKENGNSQFKKRELRKAVELYSSALKLSSKFPKFSAMIYCNRAAAKFELERWRDCITDCSKALELFPRYIKAHLRKARAEAKLDSISSLRTSVRDYTKLLDILRQDSKAAVEEKPGITLSLVNRELAAVNATLKQRLGPPQGTRSKKKQDTKGPAPSEKSSREKRYTHWQQKQEEDWKEWYAKYNKSRRNSGQGFSKTKPEAQQIPNASGWTTSDGKAKDFYKALGVNPNESVSKIKKEFRRLALACHPDKNQSLSTIERDRLENKFKLASEAYSTLSDPSLRREYDRIYKALHR